MYHYHTLWYGILLCSPLYNNIINELCIFFFVLKTFNPLYLYYNISIASYINYCYYRVSPQIQENCAHKYEIVLRFLVNMYKCAI